MMEDPAVSAQTMNCNYALSLVWFLMTYFRFRLAASLVQKRQL
jgi:hypothetical protein